MNQTDSLSVNGMAWSLRTHMATRTQMHRKRREWANHRTESTRVSLLYFTLPSCVLPSVPVGSKVCLSLASDGPVISSEEIISRLIRLLQLPSSWCIFVPRLKEKAWSNQPLAHDFSNYTATVFFLSSPISFFLSFLSFSHLVFLSFSNFILVQSFLFHLTMHVIDTFGTCDRDPSLTFKIPPSTFHIKMALSNK